MRKTLAILLTSLSFLLPGCHKSATQPQAVLWSVQKIWPRGSRPVPAPVGSAILFIQEESPAGLYLLQEGTATQVNPTGPQARTDYAWSDDGSRFCFSAPGEPGSANAGIYLGSLNAPTSLTMLWDRGSHPRFLPGTQGIVCAGPEDSSQYAGIWQLDLSPSTPQRIINQGVSPEVSPDGLEIAYLILAGITGRTLVAVNRESAHTDTLIGEVTGFAWLSDSQTLVFETPQDGQHIATVGLSGTHTPTSVAVGTAPAAFPQGAAFVFTSLLDDRLNGLYTAAPGRAPTPITELGTLAIPASANRILAQDTTGILEITH